MADEPVQPESSNNGEGGESLYDLSSVPENLREHVEPILKDVQANVTPRFQEFADLRKRWEPYDELGVADVPPENLKELLDFAKMTQDREQMAAWLREVAPEFDLKFADEGDSDDDDLFGDESLTKEDVMEIVKEAISPVQDTLTTEQTQRAQQEAMSTINTEMDALEKEHGEFNREIVARLAEQYAGDDPQNCIKRGFEDYQAIRGEGEKELFNSKAGQPSTPEGAGGAPNTAPEPVKSIDEAGERLRKRLEASEAA